MTDIRPTRTFAPNATSDDVGTFVTETGREGGTVTFYRMGGGSIRSMSENEFDAAFTHMDDADLDHLLGDWRRAQVATDYGRKPSIGWLNNVKWNGFETPVFTKADVIESIECGAMALGPEGGVFWSDRAGTFVVIESLGIVKGAKPLNEIDLQPVVDRLLANKEVYDHKVGGHPISAELAGTVTINVGGRDMEAYVIGSGWTWMLVDEPEATLEGTLEPVAEPVAESATVQSSKPGF